MKIQLTIKPVFCGPASVGTIKLVQFIRERFSFDLVKAKSIVDAAVFESRPSLFDYEGHIEQEELDQFISGFKKPDDLEIEMVVI